MAALTEVLRTMRSASMALDVVNGVDVLIALLECPNSPPLGGGPGGSLGDRRVPCAQETSSCHWHHRAHGPCP